MSDRYQTQNSQTGGGGGTPKTNQPGVNQFNQQQQQQQQGQQQQVGRGGKRGNQKPNRRSNQTGNSQGGRGYGQHAQSYNYTGYVDPTAQFHGYGQPYHQPYIVHHTAPHPGIAAPHIYQGQYQNQRLPVQQQQQQQQAPQQQPQTTGSPAPPQPQQQQQRQPTQQQQQNATGVNGESVDPAKSVDSAQGKQRPSYQQQQQQQAQQPMMMDPNQPYADPQQFQQHYPYGNMPYGHMNPMAIHPNQVYQTGDPADPNNQANMAYYPQHGAMYNPMYYQHYPNQPMTNMMQAQAMAYPPNSQHQQFPHMANPHMVPPYGVVYTQPPQQQQQQAQQQQQQPQAPTGNQEQFPANAQTVPVAQVTPAAAAAAAAVTAAAPLPQQQQPAPPPPAQPVVKPTIATPIVTPIVAAPVVPAPVVAPVTTPTPQQPQPVTPVTAEVKPAILPQLVVATPTTPKTTAPTATPTTPPVEPKETEAKFVAGLSTLPNLTVPGLSTVKPSEASFIAGLDREKPKEELVKETVKEENAVEEPVNKIEQTEEVVKVEEKIEIVEQQPEIEEQQMAEEEPEAKLGVDFPFGPSSGGEIVETGIKFACEKDNESNEEELLLTAVTNITELLFIIGEDNIGNLLSETDDKLTMPKFTEYAVKHREQVEEKMEQQEPIVELEFGAKTETSAPPSLSFGVKLDEKDEPVEKKEPEVVVPEPVVVEKEPVKSEEPKVESVSVQKKVKKVPISPIVVRNGPVVKPVRPVKKPEQRKLSDNQEEQVKETRKSKSVTELVNKLPVAPTVSDPTLATVTTTTEEMTPNVKPAPVAAAAAPPVLSWAQRMKSNTQKQQKTAAPTSQRHPAQQRAFPGGPAVGPGVGAGGEKEAEQIKIDPIAKKINDIIYAEDKSAEIDELGVPRGLINQANNCWVNSLLQTALVCEPLYKLLKKLLFYTQNEKTSDKELATIGNAIKDMLPTSAKLAEVFGEMFTKTTLPAFEPTGVYAQISRLNPDLNEGQHDAEEALSLLLNAMHEEIVKVRQKAGVVRSNTVNGAAAAAQPEEDKSSGDNGGWKTTTKGGRAVKQSVNTGVANNTAFDVSPISSGFRGLSHSSIKVAQHASPPPSEQPFFTLQLDVASPLNKTLDDAIKSIPKEEQLEGYTLKDHGVVHANRKMSLAHLPPILILHLKLFQYNVNTNRVDKLEKNMPIKETLDMPLGALSPGLRDKVKKPPKYELTGVINHHGIGAEGGHYTAETKRGRKWFKVDDNKVSEVRLSEVLHTDNKRTPYLLERGLTLKKKI